MPKASALPTAMAAASPADGVSVPPQGASALWLAGLAALLASGCCVLPLAFVLVGISGAWIAQLQLLAPWSPWLEGLAVVALGIAGWRLYRPLQHRGGTPADLAEGECAATGNAADAAACARNVRAGRQWFWVVAVLTLIPIAVPAIAPWFY